MGPSAFFRELAVSKLASYLGLHTPEPVEIIITDELVSTCAGKEFWQLVSQSVGSNFGTVFIERSYEAQPLFFKSKKQMIPKLAELYAFDAMADNADRNERKPNCLMDESNNIWLIDHELAFAFVHHLFGAPPDPINPSLNVLKQHLAFPFLIHHVVNFEQFCARLEMLPPDFWDQVYSVVPMAWKSLDTDEQLRKIKKHFEVLVASHHLLAQNLKSSLQ